MAQAAAEDDAAGEFGYELLLEAGIMVTDFDTGLILTTSIFALPFALAAFPQRQVVQAKSLEEEFWNKVGRDGKVEFNRGI